ncbi:Serine/threonine-protein kinase PEPKR2 [Acorus calamus]|uniref:Serine/threonine-protein kinase PEPKR2 n=1 Tax=Acorus calamus TaxID=4465 RepID=A0AAV9DPP1_ACOCL|nr:Serine/threonine-protein kinase PEPKR2 [Acorus calamus]
MEEESTRRKRKGTDAISRTPAVVGSHLSLDDHPRPKQKKCKEEALPAEEKLDFSRRSLSSVSLTRGIKRKAGCVDSWMRIRVRRIGRDYAFCRPIGQGKFGSVRLCRCRSTGEEFACKTLVKNGSEPVHREVEIMQHLSGHPGVATLRGVYEDREGFHIVMEMCSGGRLADQMREGRYTERRAARVIGELVSVVKYCHEMGVVHRDIKPENVLLMASGKLKLADFGLSVRVASGQSLSGIAGSPAYVAPEVLTGNYSEKVDVWSAGVLLHVLLVGVLPFQGDSLVAIFEAIKTVNLDFSTDMWQSISKLARNLIGRMLTRDVRKRITADEILSHPWITFYSDGPRKAVSLTDGFGKLCSLESSSKRSDKDGTDFVDAIAAAISRVRISEPKRSRISGPAGPMLQNCSSDMKTNLCTALYVQPI